MTKKHFGNSAVNVMLEDVLVLGNFEKNECVYFLQGALDRVKIGYSSDLKKRLASLGTASPSQLSLRGAISGTRQTEHDLHVRFAAQRKNGEWFKLSGPVEDFIDEILGSDRALLRNKWSDFRA